MTITIDDLAGMVQRGFEHMNARFDHTATKEELAITKAELAVDIRKISNGVEDLNERLTTVVESAVR